MTSASSAFHARPECGHRGQNHRVAREIVVVTPTPLLKMRKCRCRVRDWATSASASLALVAAEFAFDRRRINCRCSQNRRSIRPMRCGFLLRAAGLVGRNQNLARATP
jgi:hypothetical protein